MELDTRREWLMEWSNEAVLPDRRPLFILAPNMEQANARADDIHAEGFGAFFDIIRLTPLYYRRVLRGRRYRNVIIWKTYLPSSEADFAVENELRACLDGSEHLDLIGPINVRFALLPLLTPEQRERWEDREGRRGRINLFVDRIYAGNERRIREEVIASFDPARGCRARPSSNPCSNSHCPCKAKEEDGEVQEGVGAQEERH